MSLEEVEAALAKKGSEGNAMVANLIQQLGAGIVYTDPGNFDTNRKLWDAYADEWGTEADWVCKLARGSQGPDAAKCHLKVVGDEWSRREELLEVVREWILPYVGPGSTVAEVGCGGGRVAAEVWPHVGSLECLDVSAKMLSRAKSALSRANNIRFRQLREPHLPADMDGTLDFLYCFDVLVHVDLHVQYAYYRDARRLLKPGGKAFFSSANLLSPRGWQRFEAQKKYTVGGFYFVCPEMVRALVERAGLRIVRESRSTGGNVYYDRDFLFVVEAAGEPAGEAADLLAPPGEPARGLAPAGAPAGLTPGEEPLGEPAESVCAEGEAGASGRAAAGQNGLPAADVAAAAVPELAAAAAAAPTMTPAKP